MLFAARMSPLSSASSCSIRFAGGSTATVSNAASSSSIGYGPGENTTIFQPAEPGSAPCRSGGTSPARTVDDFPLPLGPTTARKRSRRAARRAVGESPLVQRSPTASASPNARDPCTDSTEGVPPRCAATALRRLERRIVLEHPRRELAERRRRLDAELAPECPPGGMEDVEGLRLAAGAVEREHQLSPETLAKRMQRDQGVELTDERAVETKCQVRLDALLDGCQPELLQPADRRLGEAVVGEVGKRGAAPELESLAEACGRVCVVLSRRSSRAASTRCSKRSASSSPRSTRSR